MSIEEYTLYIKIEKQVKWFQNEASQHKELNRSLWLASALLSISVALCANFKFEICGITSLFLTALLSIILPVVTAYTVLRSPESLWVLETNMRNRLLDLQQKLILTAERNPDFNRVPFEEEYFDIMGEANKRWCAIKESQGSS